MLSWTERRVVVAVVAAAVVVVVAGMGVVAAVVLPSVATSAWAVARGDAARTALWAAAHEDVVGTAPPPGMTAEPESCPGGVSLLCGWTDAAPEEALRAMGAAVRASAGGVASRPACGPGAVADDVLPMRTDVPVARLCGSVVPLADADLWLLASERSFDGAVALGRTLVWAEWDQTSMPAGAIGALHVSVEEVTGSDPGLLRVPPPEEIAPLLPTRFAEAVGHRCHTENESEECLVWAGPVQLDDLGDDPVAGVARELAAHGWVVRLASAEAERGVAAHRRGVDGAVGLSLRLRPAEGSGTEAIVFVM